MEQNVKKNVRYIYTQQVLSGFGHLNQPPNEDSNSPSDEQGRAQDLPPKFWQQKNYEILISLVIEQISIDGDQYQYKISLNDDTDIFISPISKGSKKTLKQVATIHKETNSKTRKVPMVYGIHGGGVGSLSYPNGYSIGQGITEFYSWLLGKVDRAIEHTLQQQKNAQRDENARFREARSRPQENVGNDKKTGRSKKIRNKIRNENKPEKTTKMDETGGEVLGGRSPDTGDRLDAMGNDTSDGKHFTERPLEF